MTVGELRQRMGNDEYVMWTRYYMRRNAEIELEQLKAQKAAG